jgi:transcriptional regulator with XRE-family HTH domain
MTVPAAIRALRDAYKESQQYFATRLKMSISSVAYYELGMRHPDVTAALKLFRAADWIGRHDLAEIFADIVRVNVEYLPIQVAAKAEYRQLRKAQMILNDEHYAHLRVHLMELLSQVVLPVDAPKRKKGKKKGKK